MMKKESNDVTIDSTYLLDASDSLDASDLEYFTSLNGGGPLNGDTDFVFGAGGGGNYGVVPPTYRDQNQVFSPSPPESQGPSPKSANSSPKSSSSSSSSPDNLHPINGLNSKMSSAIHNHHHHHQQQQQQMSENELDLPMLDDQSNLNGMDGMNGDNGLMSDMFSAGGLFDLEVKQDGMDLGMDGVTDLAGNQYFDFESAASSPLGTALGNSNSNNSSNIMPSQNKVPRVFGASTSQPRQLPAMFGSNAYNSNMSVHRVPPQKTTMSAEQNGVDSNSRASPRMAKNSRKRRSEVPDYSPISPTGGMALLNFDTGAHPSPTSSHASVSMNGGSRRGSKRTPTPPSSGDDEGGLTMRPNGVTMYNTNGGGRSAVWSPNSFNLTPSPLAQTVSLGGYSNTTPGHDKYVLKLRGDQPPTGDRINEKSRVETQIRVNLNLRPLPRGVTKLHLPAHTISKAKLLCKPSHQKSSDTLELYTSLICASAVDNNPAYMQRALQRACDDPLQEKAFNLRSESEAGPTVGQSDAKTIDGIDNKDLGVTCEEDKPLNGGEVRICSGCIVRERKRAARKKVKRVEDEEIWQREEGRRLVVFNTHEILDWSPPDGLKKAMGDDGNQVVIDDSNREEGAEIWLPMRIACYCRHQNEKIGFRIIFTLKDHNDNLVAQSITPPILITDDHKTSIVPTGNGAAMQTAAAPTTAPVATHQGYLIGASPPPMTQPTFPNFNAGNAGHLPYSASDTNLLGLNAQPQQSMPFRPPSGPIQQQQSSQGHHPHSRQTSLSAQGQVPAAQSSSSSAGMNGPSAKKRKGNSGKVRNDLAMTRLDDASPPQIHSALPTFSPGAPFSTGGNLGFDGNSTGFPGSGPTTPMNEAGGAIGYQARSHSMENLQALHNMFSTPSSAQQSRSGSPTHQQQNALVMAQAQAQQARQNQVSPGQYTQVHNALAGHLTNSQMRQGIVPFDISRIVPTEGPCRGGIEVTVLGSGFTRSHDVVFGDTVAPKTEYWSDTTMVCLLPPSAIAGVVQVSLRFAAQPMIQLPGRGKPFLYNDDTEHKMLALALQVINAKWSGKVEPPKDIAMRLLSGDEKGVGGSGPSGSSGGSSGGNQHREYAEQFLSKDPVPALESQLLKVLDVIDMDDSMYHAKWNLKNRQGQTMLHFACCLGMSRFTAALLARGANPDIVDRGGYTPMHFAALHNHADLVRRLILNRADPRAVSLSGQTPADMATSVDVIYELTRGQRSRRGSAASVASAPGKFGGRRSRSNSLAANSNNHWDNNDKDEEADDDEDEDSESEELWLRPKRPPMATLPRSSSKTHLRMIPRVASDQLAALSSPSVPKLPLDNSDSDEPATAALAARAAWLNLGWNFPNINWNLPNTAGYHLFPNPVARFNAAIGRDPDHHQQGADEDDSGTATPKESDYNRWWDLFSNPAPPTATSPAAPPPAYEDIYPGKDAVIDPGAAFDPDAKEEQQAGESSTTTPDAAGEAAVGRLSLDSNATTTSTIPDSSSASTRKSSIALASEAESAMTAAQRVHEARMRQIQKDRRLFFFWLPLLLIILFCLSNSWGTQAFFAIKTTYVVVKERMAEAALEARAARQNQAMLNRNPIGVS